MPDPSYFEKLQMQAFRAGVRPRTDESLNWFRERLKSVSRINRTKILKDSALKKVNTPLPGRMFMYVYDPKTKATLPYYDKFPLIIMVELTKDGFYGLNLHYLPPRLRAKFFDKLLAFKNNSKYDNSTRLKLTYDFLRASSKLKEFAPCFKRYLNSHIKSTISEVPAPEWEVAIFMPTEHFTYNTKQTVWKKVRKML